MNQQALVVTAGAGGGDKGGEGGEKRRRGKGGGRPQCKECKRFHSGVCYGLCLTCGNAHKPPCTAVCRTCRRVGHSARYCSTTPVQSARTEPAAIVNHAGGTVHQWNLSAGLDLRGLAALIQPQQPTPRAPAQRARSLSPVRAPAPQNYRQRDPLPVAADAGVPVDAAAEQQQQNNGEVALSRGQRKRRNAARKAAEAAAQGNASDVVMGNAGTGQADPVDNAADSAAADPAATAANPPAADPPAADPADVAAAAAAAAAREAEEQRAFEATLDTIGTQDLPLRPRVDGAQVNENDDDNDYRPRPPQDWSNDPPIRDLLGNWRSKAGPP